MSAKIFFAFLIFSNFFVLIGSKCCNCLAPPSAVAHVEHGRLTIVVISFAAIVKLPEGRQHAGTVTDAAPYKSDDRGSNASVAFSRLDTNHDRVLSPFELRHYGNASYVLTADANHNAAIDPREFDSDLA
ncbi:hypothetical protein DdX_21175 [Ditylenchus destructor]|uniref:EF-hand domain-containing protein n=1 Tax=Ditylenchus destructor TaxID=166010 RepID=A0AAD4MGW2_9BILA|nr:hypothetical protein DdX_21175 [Ditylenchus destructor]